MATNRNLLGCSFPILLLAAVLSPSTASGQEGLEDNLRARMVLGEFGEPACAPGSANLRPAEQGFEGVKFSPIPGAHRIVVVQSPSGWRMTFGIPELLVFTAAGFYTMQETKFVDPDSVERPAREFRLTPSGFVAMARSGECFDIVSYRSLKLVSVEKISAPERLSGLGDAYRVKFKLHYSEPAAWARTPEFNYVFNHVLNVGRNHASSALKEQILFHDKGRWLSERETMTALMLDAARLKDARMGAYAQQQLARTVTDTPERRAEQVLKLNADILRAKLTEDQYKNKITPCLALPLTAPGVIAAGFRQNEPFSLTFLERPERGDTSRYDEAMEFARRLQKIGMAKAEVFEGEIRSGAGKIKAMRYTLAGPAASALDSQLPGCLPLGAGKIESLRLVGAKPEGIVFRGWAQLAQQAPWTSRVASVFPGVRYVLDRGYGIAGTVPWLEGQPTIQVQAFATAFALSNPKLSF